MSEYRTVSAVAMLGTYEDFLELFEKGYEDKESVLKSNILYDALRNNNDEARYKIAKFLINSKRLPKYTQKYRLCTIY